MLLLGQVGVTDGDRQSLLWTSRTLQGQLVRSCGSPGLVPDQPQGLPLRPQSRPVFFPSFLSCDTGMPHSVTTTTPSLLDYMFCLSITAQTALFLLSLLLLGLFREPYFCDFLKILV